MEVKHVDIRSFALDAIRTADTLSIKWRESEELYEKDNARKGVEGGKGQKATLRV